MADLYSTAISARAAESALAVDQLRDSLNRIGDSGHLDGRSKLPDYDCGEWLYQCSHGSGQFELHCQSTDGERAYGQRHSVERSYCGLDQDHGHGSARADRSNGDRDPHPLGGFVGGRTGRQSSYWRNGRVCCRYAYGCRRSAGNAAGCAKYRSGRLVSDSHHYLCVAKPLD